MASRITPGSVVMLPDEVRTLVRGIDALVASVSRVRGARPSDDFVRVVDEMRASAQTSIRATAIKLDGPGPRGQSERHEPRPIIGTDDAARVIGCSSANVRHLAKTRRIPGEQVGGRWVFDPDDVEAYAANRARCR